MVSQRHCVKHGIQSCKRRCIMNLVRWPLTTLLTMQEPLNWMTIRLLTWGWVLRGMKRVNTRLKQVWAEGFESILRRIQSLVQIVMAVLDIPATGCLPLSIFRKGETVKVHQTCCPGVPLALIYLPNESFNVVIRLNTGLPMVLSTRSATK